MSQRFSTAFSILSVAVILMLDATSSLAVEPIDIGSRRELLVDQHLIERLDGVSLELHRPTRREIVFRSDAAWEGNGSAYQSVFQDGDRFLIYYRGGHPQAPGSTIRPTAAHAAMRRMRKHDPTGMDQQPWSAIPLLHLLEAHQGRLRKM